MRKRLTHFAVGILVLTAAIAVTSLVVGKSKNISNLSQHKPVNADPPGTINGADNKNLIPDHPAYMVFWRLVTHLNRTNQDAANRRQSNSIIARHLTDPNQIHKDATDSRQSKKISMHHVTNLSRTDNNLARSYLSYHGFDDADIKAILTEAEAFRQRVGVLDSEVERIKGRDWPRPGDSAIPRLNQLQQQQEIVVKELAKSLTTSLSSRGKENMSRLIQDRIKTKMKIFRAPKEPSGSG